MFDCFIGIGYSGAQTPLTRLKGLQVYAAQSGLRGAQRWTCRHPDCPSDSVNWNRRELAERLREEVLRGTRFLAGLDHGFSLPVAHFGRHQLDAWPAFLNNFVAHWPTQQDRVGVDSVRRRLMHQRNSAWASPQQQAPGESLRLTERWTVSARSVSSFDVQGVTAKAAHAGIPWLKWLRDEVGDRLHFWPFDGWQLPGDKSVIVEVHPSIFRRRYPREQRETEEHDAYATARWMADMAARGELEACLQPPLTPMEREVAELEGWMLGVR
ncbi:hypothetical protein [Hydrogenophaga sp. IBVHS1]|jgi:hypothetical protein|uniref:hypothetical protein n=1 Tax=unclassified Hydrogenophaga TaxID=2610897 RepID=UPI000A2E0349|nr:hypothetical protein [Hydrogenophaga sp. IBVHS1]OSZ74991.1 hypothetical protein CAP37_05965 [Hydrogenophaga sp. IBVHS1]